MAERTVLVCDACGEPATQTIGLRVGGRRLQKDLCQVHIDEVVKGARQAKRGRRKGQTVTGGVRSTAKRRGRPLKTPAKRRG